MAAAFVALTGLAYSIREQPQRFLVWNATPSMPLGFYRRAPEAGLQKGDIVLVWLPESARKLASERNVLPFHVPAIKPIAAITGDIVCADEERVTINGQAAARRRALDRFDRELPHWSGCKSLAADEVFLLSTYAEESFDGRYFGPTKASDIIEKLVPLWTY